MPSQGSSASSDVDPPAPARPTLALVLALLAVAGLCIAQMATVADGKAAPVATLTFKELDEGARFTHVRNTKGPKQANLQGDLFASVSPLTDESDTRVGKMHLACLTTAGARNFLNSEMTCTAIAALRDGTLTAQFVDKLDRTTVGSITGGTGAYANVSGQFVSEGTKFGSLDTITLGE